MTLRYTPEQVERLKTVKTHEQAQEFIKKEGVELSNCPFEIVIGGASAD